MIDHIDFSVFFQLSSMEVTLGILLPHHPPFRDARTLISPVTVEYNARQPVDRPRCHRLWGESRDTATIACPGIQLNASMPELLLAHFCLSGLLQDVGSFLAHRTFKTLTENVFDQTTRDGMSKVLLFSTFVPDVCILFFVSDFFFFSFLENLLRMVLKSGRMFTKMSSSSSASSVVTRITSFELTLLIGGKYPYTVLWTGK